MVFAFGFYAIVLYLLLQAYKYSEFAITNAFGIPGLLLEQPWLVISILEKNSNGRNC